MEHTKSTTPQDSQATTKAAAPTKKVEIEHAPTAAAGEDAPEAFGYTAAARKNATRARVIETTETGKVIRFYSRKDESFISLEVPADAEAAARAFSALLPPERSGADWFGSQIEHNRLAEKYGKKTLKTFFLAVDALVEAEENPRAAEPDPMPTKTVRHRLDDGTAVTTELPADAEALYRELHRLFHTARPDSMEGLANTEESMRLEAKYGADLLGRFDCATLALIATERTPTPDPDTDPAARYVVSEEAPSYAAGKPTPELYACLTGNQVDTAAAMLDNGERVLVMLRNGTVSTIGTGYRADMPEHGELAIYPTDWKRQDGDTLVAEGSSWVELELSWVAWNEKEVALAAQPAPENQEPAAAAAPAPAPALVTFFRKVLDEGPIDILDDYLQEGDPFTFRFENVCERDRAGRLAEPAFDPETAEALQDEHDDFVGDFTNEQMLDAALAVNEGKAGRPDGDTYVTLYDATTVDVELFEEGKRRVVHVNQSVFGLFSQLRIALGGTLDGYHPEGGVPRRHEFEHARLLALHGVNAMVEGAIAFEVWASRMETGKKEKSVLAQIHDNRPDPTPEVEPNPDDDPDEPWRDAHGNAIPDYEEDTEALRAAWKVLERRSYTLEHMDCDEQDEEEHAATERAMAGLDSLFTRMQAYAESQKNPAPSNFEHLLGRITTALAAIGFGDPDATYDADDVLTIIDQHWYDMLELTGIDQPASETAADVSAYARTTTPEVPPRVSEFTRNMTEVGVKAMAHNAVSMRSIKEAAEPVVGTHSSDSLDEARAIALADAQQRALLDTLELLLTIDKRFDLECADIASSADPSRTFPCMARRDDIKAMIDRITKTLTTPPTSTPTLDALKAAERFIAGFEDDETQEGVDTLLKSVRGAITTKGGN